PHFCPSNAETRIAPAITPLRVLVPVGIEPAVWRDAIEQTRALLIAVADSGSLSMKDKQELCKVLDQHVSRARDQPATALAELAEIWNHLADRSKFSLGDTRSS